MSVKPRRPLATKRLHRLHAPIFAALGDVTRLLLVAKLGREPPQPITQLTQGSKMTRQAVTKHLRVLEDTGIVQGMRAGRECLYKLEAERLQDIKEYLNLVSAQWDEALGRLKSFVER